MLEYKEFVKYYDCLYLNKNYKKESKIINQVIKKYKKSKGKRLLDVACGTGNHINFLKKRFNCEGLDLSQELLSVAKIKFPQNNFNLGNMTNFNLCKKFDIMTSLFSGIGYLKTDEELKQTFQNFYYHLNTGGVAIIEPWFSESNHPEDMFHMRTYNGENMKISRITSLKRKKDFTILENHYTIAIKNNGIKKMNDTHELKITSHKRIAKLMCESGFKVKYMKHGLIGRGLLVGIKQ
ncbi:MAG: methyltransferase domain-containing protein [Nanoarchaeota archaeon]|jgi:ubiquinone/menaquinone biosynthesis C-methylase UbiE|nr:methyltransferase domain-containing protein [Nanoarchaeota archaeon]